MATNLSKLFKIVTVAVIAVSFPCIAETVTDYYTLKMAIYIPRTYDNMSSLGYRKFQRQKIKGSLLITYDLSGDERPVVTVTNLVNYTHKINDYQITYTCRVDEDVMYPRVNLIGSNKKCDFKDGAVNFYLDAEPSYSAGGDDEDNSLLLTMAGKGKTHKNKSGEQIISTLKGYACGTLGCGCKAYGHISPTRVAGSNGPTDMVDDVACAYGSWTAKWIKRCKCK